MLGMVQIVAEPGAVGALQSIDARNPTGFAATHPRKAATLARGALTVAISLYDLFDQSEAPRTCGDGRVRQRVAP